MDRDYNKSTKELEILNGYLPKQLLEEELNKKIQEIIDASSIKTMGNIMKELKTQYDGSYDGKMASAIVKKLLSEVQ